MKTSILGDGLKRGNPGKLRDGQGTWNTCYLVLNYDRTCTHLVPAGNCPDSCWTRYEGSWR